MQEFGLVSVTYRNLAPREIIKAAKEARLTCIEWGSDVHVSEKDLALAEKIAIETRTAGLFVSSYGTYYTLGMSQAFAPYLAAAEALGAPILRIWAGKKGSRDVTAEERAALVLEARAVCRAASESGKTVCFEYHPRTLTDTAESAERLLEEVGMENCRLYWQPFYERSLSENIEDLRRIIDHVSIVHLFYWENHVLRRPLSDGAAYIRAFLRELSGRDIKILLEFVPEDAVECLKREAETLYALSGEEAKE